MILLYILSFISFLLCACTLVGAYWSADTWQQFWNKDDRIAITLVAILGLHGLIRSFI